MNDSDRAYIKTNCLDALQTLEEFLVKARNEVSREDVSPEQMINRTLHAIAWGSANAQSSIESAVNQLERARNNI